MARACRPQIGLSDDQRHERHARRAQGGIAQEAQLAVGAGEYSMPSLASSRHRIWHLALSIAHLREGPPLGTRYRLEACLYTTTRTWAVRRDGATWPVDQYPTRDAAGASYMT